MIQPLAAVLVALLACFLPMTRCHLPLSSVDAKTCGMLTFAGIRSFLFGSLLFLCTQAAHASWCYNINSGLGIYQPEGWTSTIEGRSTKLKGPAIDFGQSEIFLASDWSKKVTDLESLRVHLQNELQLKDLKSVRLSDLDGFYSGDESRGAFYIFRASENFIVLTYELRGSKAQIREAKTVLSSVDIRTGGLDQ